jgi:CDGSH-type Zn-finger protein
MSNTVCPQVDGPLMISGDIELVGTNSESVRNSGTAIRLCRCGQSANKPYCDESHRQSGFSDGAAVASDYVLKRPEPGVAGQVLRLTPRPNGPVHCFGVMTIIGHDGSKWHGDQANLCRCGDSANKPFCDGSHRRSGFSTD